MAPRLLFVVPCSPFYPSGIVRVEQFLPRLHADGVTTRVVQYYSAAERRGAGLVWGPGRLRNPIVRTAARLALKALGVVHVGASWLRILAGAMRADAVVFQWILPPVWMVRVLSLFGRRLVYDFDDATFLTHPHRADVLVRRAWRVVAGSHFLLDYASARNTHSVLVPSAVPVEEYDVPGRAIERGATPCIGWIGGVGTLPQLAALAGPLAEVARRGGTFRLLVAGTGGRSDLLPHIPGVELEVVDRYGAADLPGLVDRLDIGIMPLRDGAWERGKCAMKALVYMAGRRPVVASPVGESCHVVEAGGSGFLPASEDEWVESLLTLLGDEALRERFGRRGREIAEARYSTIVCYARLWNEVYSQL